MSFTSMIFLFVFLPMSLALYYISDDKVKDYVLLVLSLVFYAVGSVDYIFLFACSLVLTVIIGRCLANCKCSKIRLLILIFGILLNSGLLIYYKYIDFILYTYSNITMVDVKMKDLALPLGISFCTFKSISYLVDIYLNKVELDDNYIHDALYLSFFAQIQSGPLSRYGEMKKTDFRSGDGKYFSDGILRFLVGFSKKVLIADVLSNISNEVYETPIDNYSIAYAWLGAVCFSLQLFFDFAGYSDMAIGISEMFGFKCRENFDYPYITESISKFWRRWHISLSEWFRDYVYIPLIA